LVAWALVAELAGGIVSIGADIVFGSAILIVVRDSCKRQREWIDKVGNGVD